MAGSAFWHGWFRRRRPAGETPPTTTSPPLSPSLGLGDRLAQWVFAIHLRASRIRKWVLYLVLVLLWVALAASLWPDATFYPDRGRMFVLVAVQTLFARSVWRVLLILLGMGFFAYRWAALYLDDIYELLDPPTASRFIRQAAFASQYDRIEIKDGDIAPEYRASPIVRIGGPGLVQVHLENAAVFEKVDGTPREIGPTTAVPQTNWLSRWFPRFFPPKLRDGAVLLEGFERLRAVVHLRTHEVNIRMQSRTREGMPVRMENIRAIYHVARQPQDPTLEQPYTFRPGALIQLVYSQAPPRDGHRGWVRLAEQRLLRSTLSRIVAQHSLSEFLTTTGELERRLMEEVRAELRRQAQEFAETQGLYLPGTGYEDDLSRLSYFLSRERIRQRILTRAKEQMDALGVTVEWSGTGTWQTPPEIAVENHLKAWRISLTNRLRGNEEELKRITHQARVGTLVRWVREVPLQAYRRLVSRQDDDPKQVCWMIQEYLKVLRPVADRLRSRGAVSREARGLVRVVDYLELLCGDRFPYEWEQNPSEEG